MYMYVYNSLQSTCMRVNIEQQQKENKTFVKLLSCPENVHMYVLFPVFSCTDPKHQRKQQEKDVSGFLVIPRQYYLIFIQRYWHKTIPQALKQTHMQMLMTS